MAIRNSRQSPTSQLPAAASRWLKLSRCPAVRFFLDGLGIKIVPYRLFLRSPSFVDFSRFEERMGEYEFGLLSPEDMPALAKMTDVSFSAENLSQRLKAGQLCYGLKHAGLPVACSWIQLERCRSALDEFPLKRDEAYSADTFTDETYRGKGLAPYLMWKTMVELAKSGRTLVYGHVACSNLPSLRVQQKVQAKKLGLGVYVELLHRFHFRLRLKRYRRRVGT